MAFAQFTYSLQEIPYKLSVALLILWNDWLFLEVYDSPIPPTDKAKTKPGHTEQSVRWLADAFVGIHSTQRKAIKRNRVVLH